MRLLTRVHACLVPTSNSAKNPRRKVQRWDYTGNGVRRWGTKVAVAMAMNGNLIVELDGVQR
ncbi:hypothetical protein SESBI_43639 [Sesbania bispinosa]|nr:hypothetical protein SESBI_43639 [Sesbania bispinosa]